MNSIEIQHWACKFMNIETNIRNAVKSAHKSCGEFYSKVFNISANDKKPKNSIFLHTIANIIE